MFWYYGYKLLTLHFLHFLLRLKCSSSNMKISNYIAAGRALDFLLISYLLAVYLRPLNQRTIPYITCRMLLVNLRLDFTLKFEKQLCHSTFYYPHLGLVLTSAAEKSLTILQIHTFMKIIAKECKYECNHNLH